MASTLVLALAGCPSNGSAFDLRIDGDTISFCDGRGARKLDLDTGNDVAPWLATGTNRVVALIDTTRGGVEEIEHEGAEHRRR